MLVVVTLSPYTSRWNGGQHLGPRRLYRATRSHRTSASDASLRVRCGFRGDLPFTEQRYRERTGCSVDLRRTGGAQPYTVVRCGSLLCCQGVIVPWTARTRCRDVRCPYEGDGTTGILGIGL